ncbi:MAG: right-handed parallel beta-helix repeat-containing protein, partial [Candidatus Hodarchaeales archaeon]
MLVQPGTYYENINFHGHNIVLGSLFLTTGDTSYIPQTVIYGSGMYSSVVSIRSGEDSTTAIVGFKITNGTGSGINIHNSSINIKNNFITMNQQANFGGISCNTSDYCKILDNIISYNYASDPDGARGGGIGCLNSNVEISGNIIYDNSTYGGFGFYDMGGGIFINNSIATLSRNIIFKNKSSRGGGIFIFGSVINLENNIICFNSKNGIGFYNSSATVNNCVFWQNSESEFALDSLSTINVSYSDIEGGWEGIGNLDVDPLIIDPLTGNFNVCGSSPLIDAGDPAIYDPDGSRSDIGIYFENHPACFVGDVKYISIYGSDTTGNGTPTNPYRTIQYGINSAVHGDTVIAGRGLYRENVNLFYKQVMVSSNYIHTGDTLDIRNTIVDGDSIGSAVTIEECLLSTSLYGLTIRRGFNEYGAGIIIHNSNPLISNNIIRNNYASQYGGGIFCEFYSSPVITGNLIINNNSHYRGGGIGCYYFSSPIISGNKILENSTGTDGGGIYSDYDSSPIISNNLIYSNIAEFYGSGYGGGIYVEFNNNPIINNNVIYGNTAGNHGGGIFTWESNTIISNNIIWSNESSTLRYDQIRIHYGLQPEITYCDIQDSVFQGIGNIDVDPLFRDTANGDFHLMSTFCGDSADSPCIDAGDPNILDSLLDCSWGLGGARSDMGAYGGGDSVSVGIFGDLPSLPERFILLQNYPNPFNSETK